MGGNRWFPLSQIDSNIQHYTKLRKRNCHERVKALEQGSYVVIFLSAAQLLRIDRSILYFVVGGKSLLDRQFCKGCMWCQSM